ncbi:hypothetical protein [Pseudomonas sp. 273]|uniref:hypothetical protein n=1 Tax=Pseudomonas sp. 273 TaxID=75692 RepID=UPI0023D7ED9F|nr:hypothetical protein [Pseudomonas sp. 273]
MNREPPIAGDLADWERSLSLGAGLAVAGLALRGTRPLALAPLGLLLAWRGLRGHCRLKGLVLEPGDELQRLAADLRGLAARLEHCSHTLAQAGNAGEDPLAPTDEQLKRFDD